MKNRNQGITLIALIVTIVVLIILAGITINSMVGSNSTIKQANEASLLTDLGAVQESYDIYATRHSPSTKSELTNLLTKVVVGENEEYVWAIKDLGELELGRIERGKGEIPESVNATTEFQDLYIVDKNDKVSYVYNGNIYGEIMLASKEEVEPSEPEPENPQPENPDSGEYVHDPLEDFFEFDEYTGTITGIVENTTKDPDGIGWYYDGENPKTANKIFSYKEDTLTIPSKINGTVSEYMYLESNQRSDFSGNTNRTIKLVIPKTVKIIGECMFFNCSWLNEVVLPIGLKVIEESTFRSCSNLKTVVIPNSVEKIEARAFKGCKSLETIRIPKSVNYIHGNDADKFNAFAECTSLKKIIIEEGSTLEVPTNKWGAENAEIVYEAF